MYFNKNRKYENSYVCGPGSTPLLGLTIGQLLENTANKYGDREAVVVIHQNIRKTYQQLLIDVWIISQLFYTGYNNNTKTVLFYDRQIN